MDPTDEILTVDAPLPPLVETDLHDASHALVRALRDGSSETGYRRHEFHENQACSVVINAAEDHGYVLKSTQRRPRSEVSHNRLTQSVRVNGGDCIAENLGLRATDIFGCCANEAIEIRWFNAIVVD